MSEVASFQPCRARCANRRSTVPTGPGAKRAGTMRRVHTITCRSDGPDSRFDACSAPPRTSFDGTSRRRCTHALISSESRPDTATAPAIRRNSSILRFGQRNRRSASHHVESGLNQTPDPDWPVMTFSSEFRALPAFHLAPVLHHGIACR